MANAKKDENGRNTIIAIDNTDGVSIVPIYADPTTHALHVDDGAGGSDMGNNGGIAMLDENGVAVMTAESSAGDGTLVELYVNNSTGALLVKTT